MTFKIKTASFLLMTNEDYLGITALALSSLAEAFIKSLNKSSNPQNQNIGVKEVLMVHVIKASIEWQNEKEKIKEPLLKEVKSSINQSIQWTQKTTQLENHQTRITK
jgi:hypothetical protein